MKDLDVDITQAVDRIVGVFAEYSVFGEYEDSIREKFLGEVYEVLEKLVEKKIKK